MNDKPYGVLHFSDGRTIRTEACGGIAVIYCDENGVERRCEAEYTAEWKPGDPIVYRETSQEQLVRWSCCGAGWKRKSNRERECFSCKNHRRIVRAILDGKI